MLSFSWNLALRGRRNDTHYEIIGVDTVLGPMLFIIFVDDMSEVVKHSILKLFADDSKVSKDIRCILYARPDAPPRRCQCSPGLG